MAAAALSLSLLPLCAGQLAVPFPFGGSNRTGWLAHDNGQVAHMTTDPGRGLLTVAGVTRAYLVQDYTQTSWDQHKYVRFDLRRNTLRFTVDLSGVQCLCAACMYLSLMNDPSNATGDNYCGIQTDHGGIDNQTCVEIDIMEANTKAFQTTVHTRRGSDFDGTCNDKGCTVNWGNETQTASGLYTADLYGHHGLINTSQPFNVSASVDDMGSMRVKLSQGSTVLENFNQTSASNPNANVPAWPNPTGVPEAATNLTADAMSQGMVLVMSQWGGFDKLQSWLNGNCTAPYTPCPWPPTNQLMKIWNLELVPNT